MFLPYENLPSPLLRTVGSRMRSLGWSWTMIYCVMERFGTALGSFWKTIWSTSRKSLQSVNCQNDGAPALQHTACIQLGGSLTEKRTGRVDSDSWGACTKMAKVMSVLDRIVIFLKVQTIFNYTISFKNTSTNRWIHS